MVTYIIAADSLDATVLHCVLVQSDLQHALTPWEHTDSKEKFVKHFWKKKVHLKEFENKNVRKLLLIRDNNQVHQ